jgi:uncharacterized protein (TIGR03437 family)
MMAGRSSLGAAVLLAFSVSTARAQPATLSYVGAGPCCIAVDGNGNNFVVSFSALLSRPSQPTAILVTKLGPDGQLISNFALEVGTGDVPTAAAVDPAGNLWIMGSTPPPVAPPPNSNIPTVGPPAAGLIVKLDNSGANVLFSGTFGGLDPNGATSINAIAFDPGGNLYLAGTTNQLDFPVTPGAFISQIPSVPTPSGLGAPGRPPYGFLAKLTPANQTTPPYTVAYSTLLGGQQVPAPLPTCSSCFPLLPATTVAALAVDANGIVTAAGITDASDFPLTPHAFQTQFEGGDNSPNVFLTRLNAQGTGLIWSTFLGEGISVSATTLGGVALDATGNVTVAGITQDPNFPVTSGALQPQIAESRDVFVAKLNSTGTGLLFSTFYGSSTYATPPKLRLDAQGDIWITEPSPDVSGLVLHPNSLILGGALIAELSADGSSVLFSELLPNGVAGQDLVLNPDGTLTVTGPPEGVGFSAPISTGFALRLPRATPTGVSILGVADSAVNAVTNTVAPGEYVSIYGTGLGPAAGVGQIDANGVVSSSLGGTQVSIGGVLVPLIYASTNQLNVLVPYETAATIPIEGSGQVNMTITSAAGTSQTLPLQVIQAQPNIFVVLNSDGSVNSASNPAAVGATVSILVSGAGALNPTLPDGMIAGSPAPAPALKVQADFTFEIFEGFGAGVGVDTVAPSYAGSIPGMVMDMLEVKAPVPNLNMQGPPPFGVAVVVGDSTSPEFPFYVASPAE